MSNKGNDISNAALTLFWRFPDEDPEDICLKLQDPEQGPYLYFRRVKTQIQARFAELCDHSKLPQVFLHGSPHIDNYAKTLWGAGIVDFDRAHYGPYAWDLLCLLLALGFRNLDSIQSLLPEEVSSALYHGYLQGLNNPEQAYTHYAPLENIKIKDWEKDTRSYISAGKKWAKKIPAAAIDLDDPVANKVLQTYVENLGELELLTEYKLTNIARASGTFGRARFLYILMPDAVDQDAIILDIKQTRNYMNPAWPHNKWYHHNFEQQGERMCYAAKLYAPECVQRESYTRVNGVEYWGRQVPTLNRKPAKLISLEEQVNFAFAAGTQIGRGHSLTLQNISVADLQKHLQPNFAEYCEISKVIHKELLATWRLHLERFYDYGT